MATKYARQAELFAKTLAGNSTTSNVFEEYIHTIDSQSKALHNEIVITQRALDFIAPDEAVGAWSGYDKIDARLVDYEILDEEDRDVIMASTDSAKELYTLAHKNTVSELGFVLYNIASQIHAEWARNMLSSGWTYGVDDDGAKTSSLLVPFNIIANDPELCENVDYFANVARAMMHNIIDTVECSNPLGKATYAAGEQLSKFAKKAKGFMESFIDEID